MCMQLPTYVESVTCVLFKHICVGMCVCVYAQCVDMQCICTFFRTNTNVHVFHEIWFSIVCTSCLNVYIYMPFLLFNRMKTFQLHLHLHMLTIYFQVFVQMIDYIFEVEHTEVNTKRSTYSHIQSHTATFTYRQTDRQAGWQTDIQTYAETHTHTYIHTYFTHTDMHACRHSGIYVHIHIITYNYVITYI